MGIRPEYIFKGNKTQISNGIYDLMPLTLIEVQWLINVLSDTSLDDNKFPSFPMSRYFLSDLECSTILGKLQNPNLFDNEVNLYDQFIVSSTVHKSIVENNFLPIILESIRNTKKIGFEYVSQKSTEKYPDELWNCYPYIVEYSRRDNIFRLISRGKLDGNGSYGKTRVHNLERIIRIITTEEKFDPNIVKNHVLAARDKTTFTLVIVFDENKNIADTIINEFSPWTTRCVRSPSGQYQMTIEYDAFEYKEIGIRLLSYGCDVFIVSDSNPDVNNMDKPENKNTSVLRDIKHKIDVQIELSRTIMDMSQVLPKEVR